MEMNSEHGFSVQAVSKLEEQITNPIFDKHYFDTFIYIVNYCATEYYS